MNIEQNTFSKWIASRQNDLDKAGEGYDNLSELSKKCIDYAITRYIQSNLSEFGLVKKEEYDRAVFRKKKAEAESNQWRDNNDAALKRIIELNKAIGGMQLNIDSYQDQVDKQIREITDLQSKNDQLEYALENIANPYDYFLHKGYDDEMIQKCITIDALIDIAQTALTNYEQGKGNDVSL